MTLVDASDVPLGQSPDAQDVEFVPGGVRTRPGALSAFTAISSNPKVNGLRSYVTITLLQRLLVYTSDGRLFKEVAAVLSQVVATLRSGLRMASTTIFGNEYLGFSDGKTGQDFPRFFDDTNLDRVSQVGPGAGPAAADEAAYTIDTPGNSGLVRSANVVTGKTTAAHSLKVGNSVTIAGASDASFNGTFTVVSVPTATTWTHSQVAADATSGNGTLTVAGSIVAGKHKVVVFFETRSGYWTRPSPPVDWTAATSKRVLISNIPLGPGNVLKRRLAFTTKDGARYYHLSDRMVIDDNTTTSLVVDFLDTTLASGTNVDYLFRLEVLGSALRPFDYAQRLLWIGEENALQDFRNLSFDGGFAGTLPLGWTAGAGNAGGAKESSDVVFGDAYKITGDGAIGTRGEVKQAANLDAWDSVALIERQKAYTVRVRAKRSSGLLAGRLRINLQGTGVNTTGLQVTAATLTTSWAEYEAELTAALASIPSDLMLHVFADQTPTNNESIFIDEIRILPSAELSRHSTARASRLEEPEGYDGTNGLINVAENNGQALRAGAELADFFYFIKERSTYLTRDDGVNEPDKWPVVEVSPTVGTPSAQGVAAGEDFLIIASRDGAYMTRGGRILQENKISQEIQPTWEAVNWEGAGHTVWVVVDTRKKRALFGLPMGSATEPSEVWVLDYVEGWKPGKRKWVKWNLAANSAAVVESSSGPKVFLGNNAGNGKVFELKSTQRSDDGVAINSYYGTAFMGRQTGTLFGYLSMYVAGSGTLEVAGYALGDSFRIPPRSFTLADPAPAHTECMLDSTLERLRFKLGTNAVGDWFELSSFTPYAKPDPWWGGR